MPRQSHTILPAPAQTAAQSRYFATAPLSIATKSALNVDVLTGTPDRAAVPITFPMI